MRIILAVAFVLSLAAPQIGFVSTAGACTNSYDYASDGSRCGQRAAGCKAGGATGYC